MATSGIYQIMNQSNGKCYIGSSTNLRRRWRKHLSALRRGQHANQHLQRAFAKHGEAIFTFSVIEEATPSALIVREQHFLDILKPEYNIARIAGNPMLGRRLSLEARRKMSEAKKGERNPQYGKPLTGEHRRKIREAWTPALKQAQGDRTRGTSLSAQHRMKMSKAHMGHPVKPETRLKLSKAKSGERNHMYGKHHSTETKRKMSRANRGKHHNEDTRRKISKSLKAYWCRVHAEQNNQGHFLEDSNVHQ